MATVDKEIALMQQRMDQMDKKLDKMDEKLDMLTKQLLDPDKGVAARVGIVAAALAKMFFGS
jgi:SMC interacting uncharacterized protein involved in chromosome segregation